MQSRTALTAKPSPPPATTRPCGHGMSYYPNPPPRSTRSAVPSTATSPHRNARHTCRDNQRAPYAQRAEPFARALVGDRQPAWSVVDPAGLRMRCRARPRTGCRDGRGASAPCTVRRSPGRNGSWACALVAVRSAVSSGEGARAEFGVQDPLSVVEDLQCVRSPARAVQREQQPAAVRPAVGGRPANRSVPGRAALPAELQTGGRVTRRRRCPSAPRRPSPATGPAQCVVAPRPDRGPVDGGAPARGVRTLRTRPHPGGPVPRERADGRSPSVTSRPASPPRAQEVRTLAPALDGHWPDS